jgi:hypothetical protein
MKTLHDVVDHKYIRVSDDKALELVKEKIYVAGGYINRYGYVPKGFYKTQEKNT